MININILRVFCNSDGRDLKDCMLPKDIKKFLVDVHDFSEELSGEDIFPLFHPYVTVSHILLSNKTIHVLYLWRPV